MPFRMFVCNHCGLRFPAPVSAREAGRCPVCRGDTRDGSEPFEPHAIPHTDAASDAPSVSVILDNLRSAWNVGAIFRTADAAGLQHIYLCGITPTPENAKVRKTSLGAEHSVSWSYHPDGSLLAAELAAKGERIWALEGGKGAEPIDSAPSVDSVTWVIGNEVAGIDPAILTACERVFYLPMVGEKESLNVVIAFGAVVIR